MTRGGLGVRAMQRRTNENGGTSQPKRAASIRAESTGPSPPSEKPQGQPASIRCVGARCRARRASEASKGATPRANAIARTKEDGRRRPTVEAGWPERWRLPAHNATWRASAAGDQNLKRGVRLVVHNHRLAAVRSTVNYATETGAPNRTGGTSSTRSARAHFGTSEARAGRSRAGAPKRTPTTADDAAELTPDPSVAAAPD